LHVIQPNIGLFWFKVFNATFNTLLVKETGVSGENHRPAASH